MNKSKIILLTLSVVLTLLIAACGSDEEAPTPEPTLAPTATAVPANTPIPTDTAVPATIVPATVAPANQVESPLNQPVSPLTNYGTPAAGEDRPILAGFATISAIADNTKADEPEQGMASVSGLLYHYERDQVIPGTQYYLTPAIIDGDNVYPPTMWVGPQPEKGDIYGFTNNEGQLFLNNVPPGKYYIAVWAVYDWFVVQEAEESEKPLLVTVEAGDTVNLGLLYTQWL